MSSDVWVESVPSAVGGTEVPRLLAALPCEDAAASVGLDDQRASFQRVFYDVYVSRLPAAFDRLNIATIWTGGSGKHTVRVRLLAPDGQVVDEAQAEYEGAAKPALKVLVFHLGSPVLVFACQGRYTLQVLVGETVKFDFPLYVLGEGNDGTQ